MNMPYAYVHKNNHNMVLSDFNIYIYTYTHMPICISHRLVALPGIQGANAQALEELEKANEEERTKLEAAVKEKFNPSWVEWEHEGHEWRSTSSV